MVEILRYKDESDKSLGLAGMAIALMACDGENYLSSVSLEEGEQPFDLDDDSFLNGNPRISARLVWNDMFVRFQLITGLVIGNILCRRRGAMPTSKELAAVRDFVLREGAAECSLDNDEIEGIYNKNLSFYRRMFGHRQVIELAESFAAQLRVQRRMSAGEVFDYLSSLNNM